MKQFAALVALSVLQTSAFAQTGARMHTRPTPPDSAALNRVHLQLGWKNKVPVEGKRDGIATMQVLGNQLLVQTRGGVIALLNAENGQIIWQVRSRNPHQAQHPLGHNYNSIFGYNHTFVYGLDRANGKLKFIFDLGHVPSAPPVADAERLYICLTGGRMIVYDLTNPLPPRDERGAPGENLFVQREADPMQRDMGRASRQGYAAAAVESPRGRSLTAIGPLSSAAQASRGNEPRFTLSPLWTYKVDRRLEQPPLLTPRTPDDPGFVLMAATDGTFTVSSKIAQDTVSRWHAGSPPFAPMNRHDHMAYIGLEDGSIAAMTLRLQRDQVPGKILWRTGTGGAVEHRMDVTDDDIYVTPKRRGLLRLQRGNGEIVWRAPDVQTFLAASKKFVYGLDRTGHLLILDRAKGTVLSRLDVRDFTLSAANDYTDRIYLAAHDGQLICLRDRSHAKPLWNKKFVEDPPLHLKNKPEEREIGQPAPKKEMEKKEAKE